MIDNVQYVVLKPTEEREQPIIFNCENLSFFPKLICNVKKSFYETGQLFKRGFQSFLDFFSSILDELRYFGIVISVILATILFFLVLGYFLKFFDLVEKIFKYSRLILNFILCCFSCLKKKKVNGTKNDQNININIELKNTEALSSDSIEEKPKPSCPEESDVFDLANVPNKSDVFDLINVPVQKNDRSSYWNSANQVE